MTWNLKNHPLEKENSFQSSTFGFKMLVFGGVSTCSPGFLFCMCTGMSIKFGSHGCYNPVVDPSKTPVKTTCRFKPTRHFELNFCGITCPPPKNTSRPHFPLGVRQIYGPHSMGSSIFFWDFLHPQTPTRNLKKAYKPPIFWVPCQLSGALIIWGVPKSETE